MKPLFSPCLRSFIALCRGFRPLHSAGGGNCARGSARTLVRTDPDSLCGLAMGGALAAPCCGRLRVGLRCDSGIECCQLSHRRASLRPPEAGHNAGSDPPTPGQKGGYRRALATLPNVRMACSTSSANLVVIIPLLRCLSSAYQLKAARGCRSARRSERDVIYSAAFSCSIYPGSARVRSLQCPVHCGQFGFALFLVAALQPHPVVATLVVAMIVLGIGEAIFIPTADAIPAALAPPGLTGAIPRCIKWRGRSPTCWRPMVSAILLSRSSGRTCGSCSGAGALLSIVVYEPSSGCSTAGTASPAPGVEARGALTRESQRGRPRARCPPRHFRDSGGRVDLTSSRSSQESEHTKKRPAETQCTPR